jgi:nicotinamide riboside kinase
VRVVLTGPESTGKTSLAEQLAKHFQAPLIAEIARAYLQDRSGYLPTDLLQIATLQRAAEGAAEDADVAIMDTDLQVVTIWWQEKYGAAPRSLTHAYRTQRERHYLLCAPDLEWAPDPLREAPEDRERLFELYQADLDARDLPYSIVEGLGDARLTAAVRAIEAQIERNTS